MILFQYMVSRICSIPGCNMTSTKRVGIYVRVSTNDQTTDNQLLELRRVATQRGWTIAEIYSDVGVSGATERGQRPYFDKLCKDAAKGKLDMIAAWSIDRIGRSLKQLVTFMSDLQEYGCGFYLHQQNVDSSTAAGKAMLSMCGVFAEFERSIIIERVHAGIARAKSQGKTLGRPKVDSQTEQAIVDLRKEGKGILRIGRTLRVGTSVVQRVLTRRDVHIARLTSPTDVSVERKPHASAATHG